MHTVSKENSHQDSAAVGVGRSTLRIRRSVAMLLLCICAALLVVATAVMRRDHLSPSQQRPPSADKFAPAAGEANKMASTSHSNTTVTGGLAFTEAPVITPTPLPSPPLPTEAIKANCELVRDVVYHKWLPMAQVESDGVPRVHVAFVGDSLSTFVEDDVTAAVGVCIPHRGFLGQTSGFKRSIHRAYLPIRNIYPIVFNDLFPRPPTVLPDVELVISSHNVRPGAANLKVLTDAYAPFALAFANTTAAIKTTWLTPAMNVRAPEVLYVGFGAWDITRPEKQFNGVDFYSEDVYKRTDSAERYAKMRAIEEAYLKTLVVEPIGKLFAAWRESWKQINSIKGGYGALPAAAKASAPPREFYFGNTPKINCNNTFYVTTPSRVRIDGVYRYMRTYDRCHSLVAKTEVMVKEMYRQMLRDPVARSAADPKELPRIRLVDWSTDENRCTVDDGVHMDRYKPECRDYSMKFLYNLLQ